MRRIRIENTKRYKSNAVKILHTDTTSTDFISNVNTVTERNSTGYLTEVMVAGDGKIKKRDVVYVFPNTSPGNIIPAVTVWVKKIEKYHNGSTTMLLKLDVS